MTRPESRSVMSEGRRGSAGLGGCASSSAPSAMPTRSAPSSRALVLISAAVSGFLNIAGISDLFLGCGLGCGPLFLLFLELLHLARHDPLVAFRPDPPLVPFGQARQLRLRGARLMGDTFCLVLLGERHLLGCLFGNHFLDIGKMRVVIVSDRADGQAPRAIAERSHHPQQPLPEPEEVP